MYKKLIYSSNQARQTSIYAAENRIGQKLPFSYVEFCKNYNGAKLENAQVVSSKNSTYEIRQFIPIEHLGITNVELWDDHLIAITEDSSGNFFVFKKPDLNSIYFWDHETNDLKLICNTFEMFLHSIKKIKLDDIVVPNDTQVWIDPDFLKKQKDLGNA